MLNVLELNQVEFNYVTYKKYCDFAKFAKFDY